MTGSCSSSSLSLKLVKSDSDFGLLSQKDPSVSIESSLYQHCDSFVFLSRELSVLGDEASPLRDCDGYNQSVGNDYF